MQAINSKTLFAFISAVSLSVAISISAPAPSALAFDIKKTGQDHAGKNCERIDTAESSTFGKCENVCKDKEIIKKDVENNRYVCKASKAATTRPPIGRIPPTDKVLDATPNPTPKRPAQVGPKAGKAKN
jgi:hypothetical protein